MSIFESRNLNKMLIPYILAVVAGCMAIGSIFYSEIKTGKAYKEAAYANQKAHEYEAKTAELMVTIEKRNARIYELEAASLEKYGTLDKNHQNRQYKQTEIYLNKVHLLEKTMEQILKLKIDIDSELRLAGFSKEKSQKLLAMNENQKKDLDKREAEVVEKEKNLQRVIDEAIAISAERRGKFEDDKKVKLALALENYTNMYNLLTEYGKAKGAVELGLKQQKIKRYLPKYDGINANFAEFSRPNAGDRDIADMQKKINNQIGELKQKGFKE